MNAGDICKRLCKSGNNTGIEFIPGHIKNFSAGQNTVNVERIFKILFALLPELFLRRSNNSPNIYSETVHDFQGAVAHRPVPRSTREEGNWTLFVVGNDGGLKKDC